MKRVTEQAWPHESETVNIDQLRQFEAIANAGTMVAAAKQLHVTQPALSRSMARLEADLGASLFERKGRSISLSREGEAALEYVRAILHEERLMRIALSDLAKKASALLIATVAPAPLWQLTARIIDLIPDQLLSSKIEGQQDVERDLMNGSADLGISLKPVQYPSILCRHFMDERLGIAVPQGHRLAEKASLTSKDLDGETFVMFENVGFWADRVREALPRSRFVLQEDYAVFEQLATSGTALSFISDAVGRSGSLNGYVQLPFDDPASTASFYLLARADAPSSTKQLFETV